ncbi:MAG TPA: phosphoglycerate kinase [Dehalococcoidia bacterium]|nr:phosphoglycerate kinase [Dehalococcoidia bacterium]
MAKKSVREVDVRGKRVLVRVDFNVPLDPSTRRVLDDSRIRASLPTIRHLQERGASIVLCSHLGRPKGRDAALSLAPVAQRLAELLGQPVAMAPCCVGPEVEAMVGSLEPGGVLLLENVRFHPQEEDNDPEYARALARLADIFVNDAFAAAHRAHASTAGVASYLPAVAGLLMEREIAHLSRALEPERPYAAVIGGAKVSTKIGVLHNLLRRADRLLLGGGMANTFLKAEGFDVAASLVEDDYLDEARRIMAEARERGVRLLLPSDVVVADRVAADAQTRRVSVKDVPTGWHIVDIGDTTLEVFARALEDCRTVVWNGPMGIMELEPFARGSRRLAGVIAGLRNAVTIVGGGETAAVVESLGLADRFTHVSTGGGATLEFLEGKELPGIAVLADA